MQKFTTVLWDLDGTLLDFLYSQRIAITKCFADVGLEITEEQIEIYSRINDSYWKKLELQEVTREELLTMRFASFFDAIGLQNMDVAGFRKNYEETLGSVFSFIDGGYEICCELQGKVRQYIITNGILKTQINKLKLSGIDRLMDGIFISEQVGAEKPSGAFFEYCLERIEEKDKNKILVVGDSLSSDIKGGILAGLKTCWFTKKDAVNSTQWQADYRIDRLEQLKDIL